MIRTFADKRTVAIFLDQPARGVADGVARAAKRKLDLLHAAHRIEDLLRPPGNRLEKLRGDRTGQWSIRVNEQWRICFVWIDGDAYEVGFVDYH